MRRFLIAFFCLSTIAMAQNVVVATPLNVDSAPALGAISEPVGVLGGEIPEPATMMFLIAGVSGLAAVGGRNPDGRKRVSA